MIANRTNNNSVFKADYIGIDEDAKWSVAIFEGSIRRYVFYCQLLANSLNK